MSDGGDHLSVVAVGTDGEECAGSLECYMFNACGLRCHFDEVNHFILEKSPPFVCATETHLTFDIEDSEVSIENYIIHRLNSSSSHTGGVAFYIRRDFSHKIIDSYVLDKNLWLTIVQITIRSTNYTVIGLYHSPSSSDCEFLGKLEYWLEKLSTSSSVDNLLVIGDFNIDWEVEDTYKKRLQRITTDFNLHQKVLTSTRIWEGGHSLLDMVFTNNRDIEAKTLNEFKISDHETVAFCLPTNKIEYSKVVWLRPKIYDFELFNQTLDDKFKLYSYKNCDLDIKYKFFCDNIAATIDRVLPKKKIKLKNRYKGWFNISVLEAIKHRDQAYTNFKSNRSIEGWNEYKKERNNVVSVVRKEKRAHFESLIDFNRNNQVEMWKTLKRIVSNKPNNIISEVEFPGEIVHDQNLIAEKLNIFYINSIRDIYDSISQIDEQMQNHSDTYSRFVSFHLLNYEELKEIILSIRNKSSPDDIDINVILRHYESLKKPLLHCINSSLEKGMFPDCIKTSTIVPIKKVSNSNKAENLRPVNMLPTVEKILEKVVYIQLKNFITENNLLSSYQSGFREKYNCETALQFVINQWKKGRDQGRIISVVFMDLKRAFETIDREILVKKLRKIGFGGLVLHWIESYLTNRKQRVKVGEYISSELNNNLGVPQGSILGPLLFSLYINDFGGVLKRAGYHLFADDTLVFLESDSIVSSVDGMNEELKVIFKWMSSNKLKINVDKTKSMILCSKNMLKSYLENDSNSLAFNINNQNIETVTHYKYLGVVVDNELKFDKHIDYLCKKISKKIGFLSRVGRCLSMETRKIIYNTIVLPHFTYCCTLLFMANKTDVQRLQKLQNRGMRTILKCDFLTGTKSMLNSLQWMNVEQFIEFNTLILIYKIKNSMVPDYLNVFTKFEDVHNYNTRGKFDVILEHVNKQATHKSLFHRGITIFNNLEKKLKDITCLRKFKVELRNCYLKDSE